MNCLKEAQSRTKPLKAFYALLVFCLLSGSFVAVASNAKSIASSKKAKSTLSTDVNFNDHLINGKYQASTESMTTVENEKSLQDLLGFRSHFKDRMTQSLERQ